MNSEQKANEAQRVLNDPVIQGAFNRVEEGLINSMKCAPLGDTLTHHELVLCLQLLGRIKGEIESAITTHKLEQIGKMGRT